MEYLLTHKLIIKLTYNNTKIEIKVNLPKIINLYNKKFESCHHIKSNGKNKE